MIKHQRTIIDIRRRDRARRNQIIFETTAIVLCLIGLVLFMGLSGCASMQSPAPSQPTQVPPEMIARPEPHHVVVPPDPRVELPPQILAAIDNPQHPTVHEGILTVYPYSPDAQWTVYLAPLRATEFRLNPDETADKDSIILGDSVRWTKKINGHSVKVEPLAGPLDPNMVTNLIISTTRDRTYNVLLKLRTSNPMPAVGWYYADEVHLASARREALMRESLKEVDPPGPQLSCSKYRWSGKAAWIPSLICQDSDHVYIGLTNAPGTDTPALYVLNHGKQEIINYTQNGQWLRTDRLFDRGILVSGVGSEQQIVTIETR